MLGLPDAVVGCLFDLDGVLTRTAVVHAAAWKRTFDEFLSGEVPPGHPAQAPFDPVRDYDEYVDGRPRADGIRTFLASRGITLPEGSPDDPPGAATVHGLGERKNRLVLQMLADEGIEVYPGSVRYVRAARAAGLRTAVVSSSANTAQVLAAGGIAELFDARVDGNTAEEHGLAGKPAPDTFLFGARTLGLTASRAAVFEDALAGVEAGRAGGFACVVGVDRMGQGAALREHGADVVVSDLGELLER
jgi:beta-phosphoglucomutase family hydrolase